MARRQCRPGSSRAPPGRFPSSIFISCRRVISLTPVAALTAQSPLIGAGLVGLQQRATRFEMKSRWKDVYERITDRIVPTEPGASVRKGERGDELVVYASILNRGIAGALCAAQIPGTSCERGSLERPAANRAGMAQVRTARNEGNCSVPRGDAILT